MGPLFEIIIGVIEQGLIYGLVVMGVYLTSRIISFDDLSVEGSFGAGGAVTAQLLLAGIAPWQTLFISVFIGALIGTVTGLLHTKLGINNLICGIVVTTGL